jgi:Na+(H+)/acetate symporter ActP
MDDTVAQLLARLQASIDAMAARLDRLHDDALRAGARREARTELDATIDRLPARVDDLERRADAAEQRPASVLADPAVQSWSLRVVGIVCAAAVASSLALAGGMTYGDVSRWLPAAVSGGVTVEAER